MVGWPAWAFGVHCFCLNSNYMMPSPPPLIMGGKQRWVSNLNGENAKGERDKYQMSSNDINHKAQFLLVNTTAPHRLHWHYWPLWCGSLHSSVQVTIWGLSHCRMFQILHARKWAEVRIHCADYESARKSLLHSIWSSHMSQHLSPSKHHTRKC